jgi:hypothetical protein
MYKLKGCAVAAIKKKEKKTWKSKLNSKTKFKKREEPKTKSDIVFDANLLRRPRSAAPFPWASSHFPKEKKHLK